MYLTVNSLLQINKIITGLNDVTLRKVNIWPYGYDKMRMDEHLVADKQYRILYQFNERNVSHIDLHSIPQKYIFLWWGKVETL